MPYLDGTENIKNIPQLEESVLKYWKDNKIFEKSVEKNPTDNQYVFYDGPPFISGLPHYGHLLGSIAKDVIPRYWTMKGKRVERVWGWDAHGLPVENKVQQKLGIKNRRDIEKLGLETFTQECYKYTSETSAEWEWYVDKIARWADLKNAYKTTDQSYMESVMWVFKQLYDKGYVYEGIRTSLYCTTCGTPVSNFEIAMDNSYKEVEDPSVTIKFPITTEGDFKGINILAWTTTPWTLPSNRALVVDETAEYSVVHYSGENYLLATLLTQKIFSGLDYKVVKTVTGSELLGLSYEPPYRFYKSKEAEFKIYSYEGMVTMEEGTGVVHSAPGFGEIDTEMGMHYDLTVMMTIDEEGKFLPGDAGEHPYQGLYFSKANNLIISELLSRNILFKNEKIVHRFPFHDRCDTLLIQRAQKSWFIKVSAVKDKLIKNNEDINWIPKHLKEGRFKLGIEQAPDWCISRNRFWACPMPVWQAEDGEHIIISSKKELEDLSGMEVKDLHRPYIDEIVIKKDGKEFKRIPEVLDCWVESGSMPFAQFHYPFENKEKFEKNFPGDFTAEYIAQVRAWFYVMHVLSTMVFDSCPFKNVITTGVMAGSDGRKMSKVYGNYTDPKIVLQTYGGDALRLYLMGSPLMVGDNANFDDEELKTKLRNVINPLWNSYKYFDLYARQYHWKKEEEVKPDTVLDQWIMQRLNETIKNISQNLENYLVPPATREIEAFVDDLSRWFIRRSRDRISAGDKNALGVLYQVLLKFSQAAAPIIPFITDYIYLGLAKYDEKKALESVHLCDYPSYEQSTDEAGKKLLVNMKNAQILSSAILSLRVAKGVAVRQPLNAAAVAYDLALPKEYEEIVKEEVNIKNIEIVKNLEEKPAYIKDEKQQVAVDFTLTSELRVEGRMREFIREVQDLRKQSGLSPQDTVDVIYKDDEEMSQVINKFSEEIKKKVIARTLMTGNSTSVSKI